jgi:hypothetical protein
MLTREGRREEEEEEDADEKAEEKQRFLSIIPLMHTRIPRM